MNLRELSPSEKILLAEELWDSVAADEQLLPLTAEQKKELDARLASYSADPEAGDSWENVRERISGA
ncbi:MAG: addiction module protein [Chromatiales bacterium]|jgi:putative addiction module component (TIGR02574 family)